MLKRRDLLIAGAALVVAAPGRNALAVAEAPWSTAQANDWYQRQPWLIGCNYIPAYAINQLEMWQAESFNLTAIDRELAWAAGLGMNTARVFLHDLLWAQDSDGFSQRIDNFLGAAARYRIRPMLVLFDSCWNAFPKLGPQPAPRPGIHNSGWVQSPGVPALHDPEARPRLETYVKGVLNKFGQDERVLAWDLWNEPDHNINLSYAGMDGEQRKAVIVELLRDVYTWARDAQRSQPVTSGIWNGGWTSEATITPAQRLQLSQSDIVSFHCYSPPGQFEAVTKSFLRYERPIFCTEYLARPLGSTFESILPIAKRYWVASYNWGLVAGKTQTYLPWGSKQPIEVSNQDTSWFHDILRPDGCLHSDEEGAFLRQITADNATRRS